jgi:TonB family protein
LGRALPLLVAICICAGCGSVYVSRENADLVGTVEDRIDYDSPPMMVQAVRPEYPDIARSMGAEGVVRLKALILEDGRVGKVQVMESANPALVDAALTALRLSSFSPAKKAGQPCLGTVVIPFVFGQDDEWLRTRQGLEFDEASHADDHGFVPVELPPPPEGDVRPGK